MSSDRIWAQRMYEEFTEAPMSPTIRGAFEQLVRAGDCDGILHRLESFIRSRPDVGESIQRAGRVSFESRHRVVKAVYEACKVDKTTK